MLKSLRRHITERVSGPDDVAKGQAPDGVWVDDDLAADDVAPLLKPLTRGRRAHFLRRLIIGSCALLGLFLLYRVVWLTGWYWPYHLISEYLADHLPMAAPWVIQTMALAGCALLVAQGGAIISFVLFGRNKRAMITLVLVGAAVHAVLGWYSFGRVTVDEHGHVLVRVVERPDGSLKVMDRDFDPETGRRAHWASEPDLVMLDLQRRGIPVRRVGQYGPFRSTQGTIIVYYAWRANRIELYTGPRHSDVSGEMPIATEEIIQKFIQQEKAQPRK